MIVKPIFRCMEEPDWRLHGEMHVQRCPCIGETISLGHGAEYMVTEVATDLYQDDTWLFFMPIRKEEFVFIFWDQHNMETNENRHWKFITHKPFGMSITDEQQFRQAVKAYDKKVDEELGD